MYLQEHPGVCQVCGSPSVVMADVVGERKVTHKTTSLQDAKSIEYSRWKTGNKEIDSILGGGLVKDSVVMLAGERGAGKSTVLTTILHHISMVAKRPVLYASGEETAAPFKARAVRLGAAGNDNFRLIAEGRSITLSELYGALQETNPAVVVVDSIQCFEDDISRTKGKLEKELSITKIVTSWAKKFGFCAIIIGQFNKDDDIAGKYALQHIVDVVLTLRVDQKDKRRIIDSQKNRFGSDQKSVKLSMTADGLKSSAETIACAGIRAEDRNETPGSVVVPIIENGQTITVELLAALFSHEAEDMAGAAKREALGIDKTRFSLTLALLQKHCEVSLKGKDLFIEIPSSENTVSDRAMELGVMAAVICAEKNIIIPKDWAIFGCVSVQGSVTAPNRIDDRIQALRDLGYRKLISHKECKHVSQLSSLLESAVKDHRLARDVFNVKRGTIEDTRVRGWTRVE